MQQHVCFMFVTMYLSFPTSSSRRSSADSVMKLPGADLGGREVLDPQVAGGVDDQCVHDGKSFRCADVQSVAVTPPSTYRMCPLTKFDASLARNTAAPTRSSTSPQRRDGVRPTSQRVNSASFTSVSVSSVLK